MTVAVPVLALFWGVLVLAGWLPANLGGFPESLAAGVSRLASPGPFRAAALVRHAVPIGVAALLALAARGAGRMLAGWLGARPGRELAALGLGAGALGFGALGLGLAGLAFPVVAWPAVVAAAAPGLYRLPVPRFPRFSRAEAVPAALVAVALLAALPGALTPDITFDAQMHHLGLPALYSFHHRVFPVPWNMFSCQPALVEMHYLLGFLLSGGPSPAKLVHFSFGILACAALASWARRSFPDTWVLWAVAVFLLLPEVQLLMVWAYSDLALTAFATLAMAEVCAARPDWRLVGALAGLAMGTKANGALVAGVAVGALVVLRPRAAAWTGFLGAAFITAMPWGARNWLASGNPVAPFLPGLVPTLWWGGENLGRYLGDFGRLQQEPGSLPGPLRALARPWNVAVHNAGNVDPFGGMGGWFLWLFPPALLLKWRKVRAPALLVLGYAALWLLMPRQVRYSVPAWPAAALVCAHGAMALWEDARYRRHFALLAGAWLGVYLALLPARQQAVTDPLPYALGVEDANGYTARSLPDGGYATQVREWLDANQGESRALFLVPAGLALHFGPLGIHQSFYDTPLAERFARECGDTAGIAKRMRQMRVGWLVYQARSGYPIQLEYGTWRFTDGESARWREFWERGAEPVISSSDRFHVHRVLPASRVRAAVPDGLLPGLDEEWLAGPVAGMSAARRSGKLEEAKRAAAKLEAVAAERKTAAAYEYAATARATLGNFRDALAFYRLAESMGRRTVSCATGHGRSAEQAGRLKEAETAYRAGLVLEPDDEGLAAGLARLTKGGATGGKVPSR